MKTLGGLSLNEIMNKVTRHRKRGRYRYKQARLNGKRISLHRKIATLAFGKPLPPGVVVHHIDLDRSNNHPTNLVVCPDKEYRRLLIDRARAVYRADTAAWLISFLDLKVNV